jgi:alkanesulfonate monooxygenase SsuD/methylene tetrahydromethanopterin reductase-like flavin-dependent oxidoreductase (luciferase family)
MNADGKMRLAAYFNPTGHHVASWRHPRAVADAHINIKHYVEITQTAERAKFDLVFLADGVATRQADIEAQSRSVQFIAHFEPITLLSALAMVTERIGLVATMSTSYNEPYHVAAQIRLARSHQRRALGMESRHLGPDGRGAQFQPRRTVPPP